MKDPTLQNLDGGDLTARIAATKSGQCTWARPDLDKRRSACAHYCDGEETRGKNHGFGFCALVRAGIDVSFAVLREAQLNFEVLL